MIISVPRFLTTADQILFILYLFHAIMRLDYADPEETIPQKPSCDKCHKELKANNEFSGHNNKRLCGDCWKLYDSYVTKFFT